MRIPMLWILVLAVCSTRAWGQAEEKYVGHGYGYVAPGLCLYNSGQCPGALQFGGGGEVLVRRRLGIGGEIGYAHVGAAKYSIADNLLLLSVNGSYHFGARRPDAKLAPFFTWGAVYGSTLRSGGGRGWGGVNLGGGVHYWFRKRVGLRVEPRVTFAGCTLVGFRIGPAFR